MSMSGDAGLSAGLLAHDCLHAAWLPPRSLRARQVLLRAAPVDTKRRDSSRHLALNTARPCRGDESTSYRYLKEACSLRSNRSPRRARGACRHAHIAAPGKRLTPRSCDAGASAPTISAQDGPEAGGGVGGDGAYAGYQGRWRPPVAGAMQQPRRRFIYLTARDAVSALNLRQDRRYISPGR